jgi:hypothetical protein
METAIAAGISLLSLLIEAIPKWIAAAKVNGELTDAQEQEWQLKFQKTIASKEWQL